MIAMDFCKAPALQSKQQQIDHSRFCYKNGTKLRNNEIKLFILWLAELDNSEYMKIIIKLQYFKKKFFFIYKKN